MRKKHGFEWECAAGHVLSLHAILDPVHSDPSKRRALAFSIRSADVKAP